MKAITPSASPAAPFAYPIPVLVDTERRIITEWELSAEDLATLMNGGRVQTCVQTVDGSPIRIGIQVIE